MNAAVIDTNVLVVAERQHQAAQEDCISACSGLLNDVVRGNVKFVIDNGDRILTEYRRNVTQRGQLGVGGRFLVWAFQNRWDARWCEQVAITPLPDSDDGCDFVEFPTNTALDTFDREDRKFVAVASGSTLNPEVANATDSGWWHFRAALALNGVDVAFLCPDLMQD